MDSSLSNLKITVCPEFVAVLGLFVSCPFRSFVFLTRVVSVLGHWARVFWLLGLFGPGNFAPGSFLSKLFRSKVVSVPDHIGSHFFKKVQVGKDQAKAQSEKDSHSKNQGGKKPN